MKKGNQNAKKDNPRCRQIIFRIDEKTFRWLKKKGNPNLVCREIILANGKK